MNKEEFLTKLAARLSGLPKDDLEERLAFYNEMIDDRIEEGFTEQEAVAGIGTVDDIVSQIMSEIPLSKLVKEKVKPKGKLKAWEVVLLVLGSPIWLSLLIAAAAVIFSLYITLWAIVISLFAVSLSLAAAALFCIPAAAQHFLAGNTAAAAFVIGAGILCAGLAILMFCVSLWASKGVIRLTRSFATGIKSKIVGKEDA